MAKVRSSGWQFFAHARVKTTLVISAAQLRNIFNFDSLIIEKYMYPYVQVSSIKDGCKMTFISFLGLIIFKK